MTERYLYRLYSSPHCRCATCLENAQTVELMLQGIARAERDRPDEEHRCYFGPHVEDWVDGRSCACGRHSSLLDWVAWSGMVDAAVYNWQLFHHTEMEPRSVQEWMVLRRRAD